MKVESYTILENNIILKFDTHFKNVNYVKMESLSEIDNKTDLEVPYFHDSKFDKVSGELDSEEIKIKYSKPKDTISLFVNSNCYLLTILITQVDFKPLYYSYYLMNNDALVSILKSSTPCQDKSLASVEVPLTQIASVPLKLKDSFIYTPIKNENIFAKIKKKVLNGNQ